jgi:pyruvate dehydrogenase E1 component alpha subunit
VVFFGDGAVQAGHFNETVNLATLWALPLVLVCENNGFAEFTPRSAHTNVERVSDVVAPYGLERMTVDGADVPAVWEAFAGYLSSARAGGGPYLLECLTHRFGGHYEGDPGTYREALADAERQAKDPLLRLQSHGLAEGWFTEEALTTVAADAAGAVEQAVEFARQSPFPSPELLTTMVYADG